MEITIGLNYVKAELATTDECLQLVDKLKGVLIGVSETDFNDSYSSETNTDTTEVITKSYDNSDSTVERTPTKEGSDSENTRSSKLPKKLIFSKCDACGTTIASFSSNHTSTTCRHCGSEVVYGELKVGTYKCSCGQTGKFLMTDNVSEIRCRTCNESQVMVYDQSSDSYVGM